MYTVVLVNTYICVCRLGVDCGFSQDGYHVYCGFSQYICVCRLAVDCGSSQDKLHVYCGFSQYICVDLVWTVVSDRMDFVYSVVLVNMVFLLAFF